MFNHYCLKDPNKGTFANSVDHDRTSRNPEDDHMVLYLAVCSHITFLYIHYSCKRSFIYFAVYFRGTLRSISVASVT